MSELKAYKGDIYIPVYGSIADAQVYLKSEADKVIEELRNEADVYKAKYEQEYDIAVHNEKQLSVMRIELRHHKYKRCLAMAKWCSERIARIEKDYAFWRHGKDYASNFYKRWRKRWLELAEKFKEAK